MKSETIFAFFSLNYFLNWYQTIKTVSSSSSSTSHVDHTTDHYKSNISQFTLQDTTDKQRQYDPDVRRCHSLKTAGLKKKNKNLVLKMQALPGRIQWPSYEYYTVKGKFLRQPICWSLPDGPQPIGQDYNFSTRSPIKAFKPTNTYNK